jgi:hypothetical protein
MSKALTTRRWIRTRHDASGAWMEMASGHGARMSRVAVAEGEQRWGRVIEDGRPAFARARFAQAVACYTQPVVCAYARRVGCVS